MASGLLVEKWPLVIGVDASGIIVEAGEEAQAKYNLRPGMYVCGCTRLGHTNYSAGQEFFLMDAQVTIPKPENIDILQAATLGVGIETAALCVFEGLNVDLPDPEHIQTRDEWALVLGGASSVGWYGVQLLKTAGFKVITSCSAASADTVGSLGVKTFDYKQSLEDQLKTVLEITKGNLSRIFDAVAGDDPVFAKMLYKQLSSSNPKYFATTNDWTPIEDFEGGKTYQVELGGIGRASAKDLNNTLSKYIPVLVRLIENGSVEVGEFMVVGDGSFEDIVKAYKLKVGGGTGSKKVIVKVQEE